MTKDDIARHDERRIYCRRLGHYVPFSYCRSPGSDVPCGRIFDCWHEVFDVVEFLRQFYSDEDIARMTEPPKPKMISLVELIEQARKRTSGEGSEGGDS